MSYTTITHKSKLFYFNRKKMFSKEFLTDQIPVLSVEDTGSFALSQLEDIKLKHLPVLNDNKYAFLISEKDIFSMKNPEKPIKGLSIFAPMVSEKTSILDILRIIDQYRLTLLPVVNSEGDYKGVITLSNLLEKLGELSNVSRDGAIISLELNPQDYTLSHIVHLVEQNNAKILTLFSYVEEKTSKVILILKIDLEDASNVVRSLERFNYPVKYYAQKQMLCEETMRNRLDELMYYLEL